MSGGGRYLAPNAMPYRSNVHGETGVTDQGVVNATEEAVRTWFVDKD
jgi:hypothetical protein